MKQIVFSLQLLVWVVFMCFSCQVSTSSSEENNTLADSVVTTTPENTTITTEDTKEDTNQKKVVKSTTAVYRSDGYRPNMVSEWIEVKTAEETFELLEIWYWNVQDEKKVQLTILNQEYVDGEISGNSGELQFPNSTEKIGFGTIEDRFDLTWSEGEMQEFIYEEPAN